MGDANTVSEARIALANTITLVKSIEGTSELRDTSLDQLLCQAINALDGSKYPSKPPVGFSSRRERLLKLRDSFKAQLSAIRALPPIEEEDGELREDYPVSTTKTRVT